MKKHFLAGSVVLVSLMLMMPCLVSAKMGSGKVTAKSSDVDISIFGSLKTYPHFVGDMDFNSDDTRFDWMLDESGVIDNDEVSVRNEFRLGFQGSGKNWDFLAILESDFFLNKRNTDRGERRGEIPNSGFTGEDFGLEKLNLTYDFSSYNVPVTLETGWNTKFIDIQTGGVLYGDDHPYIGLKGKIGDINWETLTLFVFDDLEEDKSSSVIANGDDMDWRVHTLKFTIPASLPEGSLKVSPFYAYSDNQEREANVHYMGLQTFGKFGWLVPKAEFVYALGDKDDYNGDDGDIRAYAGFAAVEAHLAPSFQPYLGGYFFSGDDDANDDDIEAYNPITNISRYTGTFGLENAFIYRLSPVLGSTLYANDFQRLGGPDGYGGVSNANSAAAPGMYSLGLGIKGKYKKLSYKAQVQNFWLEETGALEDLYARDIDDEMGLEYDLRLAYAFNEHFTMGNTLSLFDPDEAIEDIRGDDYDEIAIMDTVEFIWGF